MGILCPVCESTQAISRPTYNGYALLGCPDCGLIYTAERTFPAAIYDELYASDSGYLARMRAAEDVAAGRVRRRQVGWFRLLAVRWLRGLPVQRTVFDIGCGTGVFLLLARRMGWAVVGVEPAAAAAAKARSLGLDVTTGYAEDYARSRPVASFGVVSCFEVLEHVADPVALLRAMHRLLAPSGYLILSVPNAGDPYLLRQPWQNSAPPVHINFFGRRSLRRALERAGFRVLRMRAPPVPTTSVRNLYGLRGWALRLPLLLALRLVGKSDGSGLLVLAQSGVTRQP